MQTALTEIEPVSPMSVVASPIRGMEIDCLMSFLRDVHRSLVSKNRKRARKACTDHCLAGHALVAITQDEDCYKFIRDAFIFMTETVT